MQEERGKDRGSEGVWTSRGEGQGGEINISGAAVEIHCLNHARTHTRTVTQHTGKCSFFSPAQFGYHSV